MILIFYFLSLIFDFFVVVVVAWVVVFWWFSCCVVVGFVGVVVENSIFQNVTKHMKLFSRKFFIIQPNTWKYFPFRKIAFPKNKYFPENILHEPNATLITIESIKNEIQPLQNFGPLNVEQKNCEKCYIHNIFVTNTK